jgi:hypothetical protein
MNRSEPNAVVAGRAIRESTAVDALLQGGWNPLKPARQPNTRLHRTKLPETFDRWQ